MIFISRCHFAVALSACVVALFCLPGCGPTTARISGKVTLNGQPVPGAELIIAPVNDSSRNYRGLTIADGSYQIDYGPSGGLPLGEYKLTVAVYQTAAGALLPEGEAGQVLKNSGQAVQQRYVLNLTVAKTVSQLDFELGTIRPEKP